MPTRTELLESTLAKIEGKETSLQEPLGSTISDIDLQIGTLGRMSESVMVPGISARLYELGIEKMKILARKDKAKMRLEEARTWLEGLYDDRLRTTLSTENYETYKKLLGLQQQGIFSGVDAVSIFLREVDETPTADPPFERFYRAVTDGDKVHAEAVARLVKTSEQQAPTPLPPETKRRQTHLTKLLSLFSTAPAGTSMTIPNIFTIIWGREYSAEKVGMVYNLVKDARRHGANIKRAKGGAYYLSGEPATRVVPPVDRVVAKEPRIRQTRENTQTARIIGALKNGSLAVLTVYRMLNPKFTGDRLSRSQMQRVYNAISEARKRLLPSTTIDCVDGQYTLISYLEQTTVTADTSLVISLAATLKPTEPASKEEIFRAELLKDSEKYPLGLSPDSTGVLACAVQASLDRFTKLFGDNDELTKTRPSTDPQANSLPVPPASAIARLTDECLTLPPLEPEVADPSAERERLQLRRKILFERVKEIIVDGAENPATQLEKSNPHLLELIRYLAQLNHIRVRFPQHPDVNGENTAYDLLEEVCTTDGRTIFGGRVPLKNLAVDFWTKPKEQLIRPITIVNFSANETPGTTAAATLPNPHGVALVASVISEVGGPKKEEKKPRHPKPARPEKSAETSKKPEFGSEESCRPFIMATIEYLKQKHSNLFTNPDLALNPAQIVRVVGRGATTTVIDRALKNVTPTEIRRGVPYYDAAGLITALVIKRQKNLPPQTLSHIEEWVKKILAEEGER